MCYVTCGFRFCCYIFESRGSYHLTEISKKYKNVFYDTSVCSPKRIARALNEIGEDRIIFGSDEMYYRLAYCVAQTYKAVKLFSRNDKNSREISKKIFYENFKNISNIGE